MSNRSPFTQTSTSNARRLFRPKVPALVLTYSEESGANIMTAMWWTSAAYHPPQMLLAVEHDCYTYEILQKNNDFVMAIPSVNMIDVVTVCGQTTGIDMNKIDFLDLTLLPANEVDAPLLKEAGGNIECKTVHTHTYQDHTYYFADPKAVHVRKEWFDNNIYTSKANPLLYMGSQRKENETIRYYTDLSSDQKISSDKDIFNNSTNM